jgi:hypothetical protein
VSTPKQVHKKKQTADALASEAAAIICKLCDGVGYIPNYTHGKI